MEKTNITFHQESEQIWLKEELPFFSAFAYAVHVHAFTSPRLNPTSLLTLWFHSTIWLCKLSKRIINILGQETITQRLKDLAKFTEMISDNAIDFINPLKHQWWGLTIGKHNDNLAPRTSRLPIWIYSDFLKSSWFQTDMKIEVNLPLNEPNVLILNILK